MPSSSDTEITISDRQYMLPHVGLFEVLAQVLFNNIANVDKLVTLRDRMAVLNAPSYPTMTLGLEMIDIMGSNASPIHMAISITVLESGIFTESVKLMNGVWRSERGSASTTTPRRFERKVPQGGALIKTLVQENKPEYNLQDPEQNGEGDLEDALALFFGTKVGPDNTNRCNSDTSVGGDSRQERHTMLQNYYAKHARHHVEKVTACEYGMLALDGKKHPRS